MDNDSHPCPSDRSGENTLWSLLAGPGRPTDDFLAGEMTFGQLYGLARAMGNRLRELRHSADPICLCTEERGLVATTLLAALIEGVPLIVPHAFDDQTLAEAKNRMGYTHAVVDRDRPLPAGVTAVTRPDAGEQKEMHADKALDWHAPWLYLFTGGSTGTPQIWSKTPCNLLAEAAFLTGTFGVSPADTILATVPTNHIYGMLYGLLLPLISGAGVCAATPTFPHEIAEALETKRATVLVSIPAHYRALKETPIRDHQVRIAFSSAGPLPRQDAVDFHAATGIAVTEIYGSTETGGIAQRTRAKGETALNPFDCAQIRIDNQHLNVQSPFLSAELPKGDDGFFETADRAEWIDSSAFALLGRSDGVVKVGGKRVDLAVIKEILMDVDSVQDVYVYAQPVESGRGNEILALVEGTATTGQLNDAVHRRLPPHARPRSIEVTRQMPVTSTGKYRRTAIEAFFKYENQTGKPTEG